MTLPLLDPVVPLRREPVVALHRAVPLLVLVVLVFGGTFSGRPLVARADGIGISPAILEYVDALRGGTYTATLTLSNTSPTSDNAFEITAIGDTADWITLELREDGSDASRVVVGPDSSVQIAVLLTVPADAANGAYTGALDVLSTEIDEDVGDGSGAGVQIGGLVDISVQVVGDQRRQATVGDMYVDPAEVGMMQRFNAVVQNLGNVQVEPVLEVEISRDGAVVDRISSAGTMNPVLAGTSRVTFVEWDTSERTVGTYQAAFRVTDIAGGEPVELGTRVVEFRVDQLGTYTRQGTLDAFVVLGEPQLGALTNVEATFTNTGRIASAAIATVEMYRDGVLVATEVSLERATRPGETAKIVLPVPTSDYGDYRLVGTVNYEGLVTDPLEVEFSLVAPTVEQGANPWLIGGATGAALAVVALGGSVVMRRRRRPIADGHELTSSVR